MRVREGARPSRGAGEHQPTFPFAAARFDLVTSFDVFQCLPDEVERSAIREMSRVLKPGGWLLLHVAALEMLHGKHSVLSEEDAALHAGAAAVDGRGAAASRSSG